MMLEKIREKWILVLTIFILMVLLITTVLFKISSLEIKGEIDILEKKVISLENENMKLSNEKNELYNKSLELEIMYEDIKKEYEENKIPSELTIDILKNKGIKDYNIILKNLENRKDLIMYKGVLGGEMNFVVEESILLNDRFVFAYFEDGHIAGYSLLSYNVDSNLSIDWKVIKSFLID